MLRAWAKAAVVAAAALPAACTTADVLEPSAMMEPAATGSGTATAALPTDGAATRTGAMASVPATTRIQLAPLVGATVEAAAPLSERLALDLRRRGIALARSDDAGTTHVLKGYLSALPEGDGTTVIYVWDILDPAGNRLHRIQGQARAAGGGAEGWDAVTPELMASIADSTVEQLVTWLGAQPG